MSFTFRQTLRTSNLTSCITTSLILKYFFDTSNIDTILPLTCLKHILFKIIMCRAFSFVSNTFNFVFRFDDTVSLRRVLPSTREEAVVLVRTVTYLRALLDYILVIILNFLWDPIDLIIVFSFPLKSTTCVTLSHR